MKQMPEWTAALVYEGLDGADLLDKQALLKIRQIEL